jgi:hypothetical protein
VCPFQKYQFGMLRTLLGSYPPPPSVMIVGRRGDALIATLKTDTLKKESAGLPSFERRGRPACVCLTKAVDEIRAEMRELRRELREDSFVLVQGVPNGASGVDPRLFAFSRLVPELRRPAPICTARSVGVGPGSVRKSPIVSRMPLLGVRAGGNRPGRFPRAHTLQSKAKLSKASKSPPKDPPGERAAKQIKANRKTKKRQKSGKQREARSEARGRRDKINRARDKR